MGYGNYWLYPSALSLVLAVISMLADYDRDVKENSDNFPKGTHNEKRLVILKGGNRSTRLVATMETQVQYV